MIAHVSDSPFGDVRERLPDSLLKKLDADGQAIGEIREAAASDLKPDGRYGEEWLLVTGSQLLVYSMEEPGARREPLPDPSECLEPDPTARQEREPAPGMEDDLCGEELDLADDPGDGWLPESGMAMVELPDPDEKVTWRLRRRLPLSTAARAGTNTLTCGGELTVEVGGLPQRLMLFSAALFDEFVALRVRIAALAQGRETELEEDGRVRGSRCRDCGRALEPGTEECPHCTGRGRVLFRLVRLAMPYRARLGVILGLLLLGVGIGLVPPFLVRTLIDRVLTSGERPDWLLPLVLSIFVLQGTRAVINMVHGRLAVGVGSRLTTDLRRRLFAHLTGLSVSFFDRTQVGRLMTRVAQDTEELHVFIGQALRGFLVPGVMAVGITAMLFWLNPVLAVYVLLPIPLVAVATYFFYRSIAPRHQRYYKTRSRINAFLNTCLSGIRVVKAFGQEPREQTRFAEHNEGLRSARMAVDQVWAVFFPGVLLAFQSSVLLVWYFGGSRVLAGEVSLGTMMAFLGYLGMLHGPVSVLSQVGQWLTRSLTSAQRIFEMLDRKPEIVEPESPKDVGNFRGEIEFRNVTFGYVPNQPVLRDVSFRVRPGEVVGVVGRSGAGKTTLAGLTARFYDPQKGQVLLDGRDARTISSADLRRHVGLVLQSPFIFRGTIAENIAYGKPGANRQEVLRAATAADCHEFVSNMPLGYDSEVGERGAGLSGGEKQRVSIGRAILHDPQVLILDEATSSLDTEAERLIHEALARLVKGRTTMIIAHRLSTLRGCDRILVMDRGRLAESGTHESLMRMPGGIYRGLVESQDRVPLKSGAGTVPAA